MIDKMCLPSIKLAKFPGYDKMRIKALNHMWGIFIMEKLKVFLAEDEFVVREGIKNNIDWNAHGFEFCGEAGDGELAFSMIQKEKPDIVITDIRMPFMDGLMLSRLIKKELPDTEIIILTGYEEFEYAKEAIRIGVAEYLTKPINSEALVTAVDELAEKIKVHNKEQEIREKYMQEMQENYLKERKELFAHLVVGSKSVAELLEYADRLDMDLSAMCYNIVLIKMQFDNQAPDAYSKNFMELEEKINALDDETHLLIFDRNLEGKALLFKADSKEELLQVQSAYIEKLKNIWSEYENIRYFGGIGMPVQRLREVPISFEAASHAFAHQYLLKGSLILNSSEIEKDNAIAKEEFNIRSVNPKQVDRARMKEFLKVGDKESVIYFVEEFFHALGTNVMQSNLFRQYIIMDAYFCVVEFVEGLQCERDCIKPPDVTSSMLQKSETAMDYIAEIIEAALELRDKAASNHYGDIVGEVKRYIEQNYGDEDLSLNVVAAHVNFSPNHLSTVFSQQTGQTFTKYLTDFRMKNAKELLRCTGKRSSEISAEVGYKDSHYFSYLFRKTQGMTPTQYRGERPKENGR